MLGIRPRSSSADTEVFFQLVKDHLNHNRLQQCFLSSRNPLQHLSQGSSMCVNHTRSLGVVVEVLLRSL